MSVISVMRRFLIAILLVWMPAAQALVAVPPIARIADLTGTLTNEQSAQLEARLSEFEQRKGSQIAVLMVPTTQPETIEQYALRVAEQWKLGRKKVDDGALLVVAKNDRALRIEVGYGLEGALNDAVSKRIVSDIIVPYLRNDDFYGGISAGVDAMIHVIDGEPLPPSPNANANAKEGGWSSLSHYFPFLVVFVFMVGGALRAMLGRFAGAAVTGGLIGGATWLVAGLASVALAAALAGFLFTLMAGVLGPLGAWSSGYGRGGFDGGFRGGDFRGGGGTFGGGGASGRW